MAITQQSLIGWQAVDESGDLKNIRAVLDNVGDEALMLRLEAARAGRRDKYPLRAVWNTLLAAPLLGHPTMAALLRELRRNAELRQLLGYDPMLGSAAVPPDYVVSRLVARLEDFPEELDAIFRNLVARFFELFPDFGTRLAIDGKAIHSVQSTDPEAGTGRKTEDDGKGGARVLFTWHGYKIHCLSDTQTELPIAFRVTAPSEAESPHLLPLVEEAMVAHPELAHRATSLAADKGYDDGADKRALWEVHGIAPIIPARDLARGEYKALRGERHDTIYLSPTGQVACRHDPFRGEREKQFCDMQFMGFEGDRETLKFRCPAAAFGVECKNREACQSTIKDSGYGRIVRVALGTDPRLLTPVHQGSQRFAKLYAERTSIERLFYRLDHLFGMEAPLRSRGLARAKVRVTLAMSAMMATALGWVAEEKPELMRSRLQTSAA